MKHSHSHITTIHIRTSSVLMPLIPPFYSTFLTLHLLPSILLYSALFIIYTVSLTFYSTLLYLYCISHLLFYSTLFILYLSPSILFYFSYTVSLYFYSTLLYLYGVGGADCECAASLRVRAERRLLRLRGGSGSHGSCEVQLNLT